MTKCFSLALLSAWLAFPVTAFAASDGEVCDVANGECARTPMFRVFYLISGQHDAGGTSGTGVTNPLPNGAKFCTVEWTHVQPSCTVPNVVIDETDAGGSPTCGASSDTVWTTIGTLTGGTGPAGVSPSQLDPLRPVGPCLRGTLASAIADADCTDVDVTIKCSY